MKPPFPDRESTFDAFAGHVSRGKVAFFQKAGLDRAWQWHGRRRPYSTLLPGPVQRRV
jgi:hypothetical protein